MGYTTEFQIESTPEVPELLEIIQNLDSNAYANNKTIIVTAKWYEFESDLKRLSVEFPNTLLQAKGYGEESGDIWIAYAFNGGYEKHEAIVTFPPPTFRYPEF